MNKYGLTENDSKIIDEILKKYTQIKEVIIFGSRAMNTFKASSDIDFAVKGEKISSVIGDIIADFEESDLIFEVDIVDYERISAEKLLEHINNFGKLYYRKGWDIVKNLPHGWRKENLVENLEQVIDYRGKTPKKSETGIVTLSAKSVKMGYIDYEQAYYISKKTYDSFMVRGFPKKGDILMTTEAPLGCIAKLDRENVTPAQRLLTLRGKKDILHNDYLMYYLMSPLGQHELHSRASGTTVQGIKRSEFENVKIILPETYEEQKAIADVLSSLDEKIELLQEENKTLEELAQTIFKEWFVDFNFPGATGEMEESELGEIPKGWRVYGLNELVDTISGYAYKGKELVEESEKALVTLKSFNRNGGFQTRGFKPFIGTPKEEQKVHIGGLVVAHTDLTQDAEVLGNPAFIFENAGYKEMFITMDLVKVLSVNENIDNSFLYYLMKDSKFKGHCVGYSNGTTVLHLSKKAIPEYRIALSEDLKLAKDFSAVTKELTNKISNNIIQIQTLSKTKETLLPKLMSGEIRVEGFGDEI